MGGGDVAFDYSNPLVDRFLDADSFRALYLERYADLYEALFVDGAVTDLINEYSTLLDDANCRTRFRCRQRTWHRGGRRSCNGLPNGRRSSIQSWAVAEMFGRRTNLTTMLLMSQR